MGLVPAAFSSREAAYTTFSAPPKDAFGTSRGLRSSCPPRYDRAAHGRATDLVAKSLVEVGIGNEPCRTPGPAFAGSPPQRTGRDGIDAVDHHLLGRDERTARAGFSEREADFQNCRCRPYLLVADGGKPVQRFVMNDVAHERSGQEDEVGRRVVLGARLQEDRLDLALRRIVASWTKTTSPSRSGASRCESTLAASGAQQQVRAWRRFRRSGRAGNERCPVSPMLARMLE